MTAPPGLAALVPRLAGARVWVVGDVILDEYVVGDVERISPEAPVPVVKVHRSEHRPGGAANVARNLAALGARVELCGVVGADPAGSEACAGCAREGIGTEAALRDAAGSTTRKLRVVSRRQHLVRMDWEGTARLAPDAAARALDLLARGPAPDAIVVSDYAKGFVTDEVAARAIALGRARGAPVLVDPRGPSLARYRGATLVKPNRGEAERVLGRPLAPDDPAALEEAARALLAQADAAAVVVTLGELGMAALERGQGLIRVPAVRREVYDVTGAGDTVLAVLALGLAARLPLADAAGVANAAAGIVVERFGAAVVGPRELEAALLAGGTAKRLARADAAAQGAAWRRSGKRVVFTNGCFDLLHAGHLSLLRRAAALGDVLVVGLNSDASVRRLKGPGRPVVPEQDRLELLAALECVDAVVAFDEDTPLSLIQALRPAVLVKGADYALDQVVGRAEVESWDGEVVLVPVLPSHSTTGMLERIAEGRPARA